MRFLDTVQDLAGAAASLESLAAAHQQSSIAAAARELSERLRQNRFHLVVVGQFKRGKTTLLNALLGEPVLPVAVLPLTSVITVLRHGESPGAIVHLHSGRQSRIELEELSQFVTESGNPRNVKQVSRVEVFYPSPYLRGGVTLIDTPGVASVYEHNTQVTYDFIPRIDAAIFVTSPEPPLTAAEIAFLEDLGRQVSRVFLVMNKADLAEPAQLAEVLEFAQHSLSRKSAPAELSILPVSARLALEAKRSGDSELLERSGFPALEKRIEKFLREEKREVFQQAATRTILRLAGELRMLLQLEMQAARMPVEELQAKIAEFDRQLQIVAQQREDNEVLLRAALARLSAAFERAAREFAESQVEVAAVAARQHFAAHRRLPKRKLAEEMDRFIARKVQDLFEGWRRQFEPSAVEEFRAVTARFQQAINELTAQVRRTAADLFAVELTPLESTEELAWVEPTGYYTDALLDWGLGNAPLMLPGALFRRYLLRRVLKAIPEELDRNATRVAYDFKNRLQRSVSEFQRALERKLEEASRDIQQATSTALERHQAGAARAAELAENLSGSIQQLDLLIRSLGGMVPEPADVR